MDREARRVAVPWGHKESDTTEDLNWTELMWCGATWVTSECEIVPMSYFLISPCPIASKKWWCTSLKFKSSTSSEVMRSASCSVASDSLQPHGWYSPWGSPGQNTGVGSVSLLQWIPPIQGSNPGLLHCRRIPYHLSHQGNPRILEWVAFPFSSRSSQPRNRTGVSRIAGGFFTSWTIREAHSTSSVFP